MCACLCFPKNEFSYKLCDFDGILKSKTFFLKRLLLNTNEERMIVSIVSHTHKRKIKKSVGDKREINHSHFHQSNSIEINLIEMRERGKKTA